jgi:surface protein
VGGGKREKYMYRMFGGASHFNGDLSRWNISNVTDMSFMFEASGYHAPNSIQPSCKS